ncbi:MAG: hypothetical protein CM1200mP25_1290 [Acidobacteriota bacterium]|nr:MAG: hypothetical protein CM1200mP25_1290 [Acidobacteriota bacterium]
MDIPGKRAQKAKFYADARQKYTTERGAPPGEPQPRKRPAARILQITDVVMDVTGLK